MGGEIKKLEKESKALKGIKHRLCEEKISQYKKLLDFGKVKVEEFKSKEPIFTFKKIKEILTGIKRPQEEIKISRPLEPSAKGSTSFLSGCIDSFVSRTDDPVPPSPKDVDKKCHTTPQVVFLTAHIEGPGSVANTDEAAKIC